MVKTFYITAAPVGAVPKFLDPLEPKFIPHALLELLPADAREATTQALEANGWEAVPAGGIVREYGYDAPIDLTDYDGAQASASVQDALRNTGWTPCGTVWHRTQTSPSLAQPPLITRTTLERLSSVDLVRQIVLQLTTFGWTATEDGSLTWTHERIHSYLSPDFVERMRADKAAVLESLFDNGWRVCGAGYWQPGKARSPYLPITADGIVDASREALREGAAVVHLHTRATDDQATLAIPGLNTPIGIGSQRNHIVLDDYDRIVPTMLDLEPSAILNLSTSARGDRRASQSPLRRAHLKRYGHAQLAPDVASFSPGPVVFQAGGGYDNPNAFLADQLAHFAEVGVRPEIEVFNHTIVENSVTLYQSPLVKAGVPVLFMLVAAVDQYHRDPVSGDTSDDSLIDVPTRKAIAKLLQAGTDDAHEKAVELAATQLRPTVDKLRDNFPSCKISLLLPGPFQALLVDVAIALDLDGIRVGLEDALNVFDARVPGGVRKACGTGDQVRWLRLELERRGIGIVDAEALRDELGMSRPDVALFRQAEAALAHYPADERLVSADTILDALRPIVDTYRKVEDRLATHLASAEALPADPAALAEHVLTAARSFGVTIRSFVEELDRYEDHEYLVARYIQVPQALNFARELLVPRGYSIDAYDRALEDYARPGKTVTREHASYSVRVDQFKPLPLRCLEYLVGIPCRYNGDYSNVVNLGLRQSPRYSATMALLYHALRELTLELRERSNASRKTCGPVWTVLETSANASEPPVRRDIAPDALTAAIDGVDWVVLPSTPTTNYPLGLKLANGMAQLFHGFVAQIAADPTLRPSRQTHRDTPLRLLAITHSGRRDDGETVIEASMLHNRFALNADPSGIYFSEESQLIYERLILPRLVDKPAKLAYNERQLVRRDTAGFPLYQDGSRARRIKAEQIERLPFLKCFAHSSGIATAQQLDVQACRDGGRLGLTADELRAFFDRALLVSFGSAADIHLDWLGTSVVDVTAFNDVRSLAGTTSRHYLIQPGEHADVLQHCLVHTQPADYRYDHATPVWQEGRQGKVVARLTGVFLLDDHARLDDGHSIRRYLAASPLWLRQWIARFHDAPADAGAHAILRELQASMTDYRSSANQTTRRALA
ncbi:3-keto-5-aminohexanoate cleavage protein [Burkholderia pseudomallei]|uniref:3-keto-5-aminohexanoate cleavage protein n=1 Tax=Burkholderia pseudomallei TaxID=28450 RepID=UPI000F095C10|nr:3-keto-5-aminohexanoate cleavage protein [Burkholderia pseudomallei]CAJ5087106.1 Uncharacterized conserved protein [Burkholderia pseudomallei]CAJ5769514.1 Uncharacterized conserved protein [Burkholderia pseudomallei]CAJ7194076.1 Uncharacterized conserved protein [Burkholderia pseudomallei]CAJ7529480.1 Uncharacterized conserved protein [Burkholderia pseudomallei]CAJ7777869.1 Uncharacterized conserved protein [Burkholderia pseudomallei]